MAAFEGHDDEPSDDDDSGSLSTSDGSERSYDEQRLLYAKAKAVGEETVQQHSE